MKKFKYQNWVLLIVAFTSTAFLACETSGAAAREQPGTNSGRLIIRRAANLGIGLFLDVSIDGVKAGTVGYGQTYDGPPVTRTAPCIRYAATQPVVSVPNAKDSELETGKTYAFTAMWRGQTVVLR